MVKYLLVKSVIMTKKKRVYSERELLIIKECKSLCKLEPKLKRKKLDSIVDLDKRLYYHQVWFITESQPLHLLGKHKKRCFKGSSCYHLDHICPIIEGYINKIPPEVIGHIKNLRFIPASSNIKKGSKVTKSRLQETIKKGKIFKRRG